MDPISRLRTEPTDEEWYFELHRIFCGERDCDIERIGGTQQYVRRILIESHSQAGAKAAFGNALERAVLSWHPEHDSVYHSGMMLELVTAFCPLAGFTKILGPMLQWGGLSPESDAESDLHSKALVALQAYYPVAPPQMKQDPAFESYTGLLWRELEDGPAQPHAVRRLLELKLLKVTDARMTNLLRREGVLQELLRHAMGPGRRILSGIIAPLFACSVTEEASYKAFTAALELLGARLVHLDQAAAVQPRRGRPIVLAVPLDDYMMWRYLESEERGRAAVKAIAAGAEGYSW